MEIENARLYHSINKNKPKIMQYIFDSNYYRTSIYDRTSKEIDEICSKENVIALFPTIVSIELINHLSIEDDARINCIASLKMLFKQTSNLKDGRASGTIVPTFYDLLTLYFFSKESKNFSLSNKTLLMTKEIFEDKHQTKEFSKDIQLIKEFKRNELKTIIDNLEKHYLSSFNDDGKINWKIFQENSDLGNEFKGMIENGELNKLFGLSLLNLAINEVGEQKETISKEYFEIKFLKDFEISIDFFVIYILEKLLKVKKTDYLKYPETDTNKKRWNSFYDFQLIFATEFENSKGRKTIFVTRESKIIDHFKKFKKGHMSLSFDEFNKID